LRLLEKVTNGCVIQINETGTNVTYTPGVIVGGSNIEHECGTSRGISYFLEALICVSPFAKAPLDIILNGVTNHPADVSIDLIRTVTLPLLQHFGIEEGLFLKIKTRGFLPLGGGSISFKCPIVRKLKPIQLVDEGKVNQIRGIVCTAKVTPQLGNKAIEAARGVLNKYADNVYIYSDYSKGKQGGLSAGYSLALVAETSTGCIYCAEQGCDLPQAPLKKAAQKLSEEANEVLKELPVGPPPHKPEEIGKQAAFLLLQDILKGGCVDSTNQWLVLLLMVLCQEDVSKVRLGKLSPNSIIYLRTIKDFFGTMFMILEEAESVILSCVGCGYENVAQKVY